MIQFLKIGADGSYIMKDYIEFLNERIEQLKESTNYITKEIYKVSATLDYIPMCNRNTDYIAFRNYFFGLESLTEFNKSTFIALDALNDERNYLIRYHR
jgi:hypothetical protein